jgi:hypothetical protein
MAAADRERGWRVSDRLAGALGLARSLAIYHGQPWRTRALNRHYAEFVGPGDLAFDVGAHVGNHTRSFLMSAPLPTREEVECCGGAAHTPPAGSVSEEILS